MIGYDYSGFPLSPFQETQRGNERFNCPTSRNSPTLQDCTIKELKD